MKKELLEKKIKQMIGLYLIPVDTTIEQLKLEMADILIFKEWLDIDFGDIFDIEKLTSCNTIGEIINYVVEKVQNQHTEEKQVKVQNDRQDSLEDTIGFLILELSVNDTHLTKWDDLPEQVQALFKKTINTGINVKQAEIRQKDQELFTLNYLDAEGDFSASYIIYREKLLFAFEN